MADYLVTDTELTSIADAIRTKGGTSADLSFPTEFVSAINNISTGGGTATVKTVTKAVSSASNSISFTGLSAEPASWSLILTTAQTVDTSSLVTIVVAMSRRSSTTYSVSWATNTGTLAAGTYGAPTYSNGTLTISTGTNIAAPKFYGGTYRLIYTYVA